MSAPNRTVAVKHINVALWDACSQSGHLLHVPYALQQRLLHISREAVRKVAAHPGLPVSQAESVVEFYSFFTEHRADGTTFC